MKTKLSLLILLILSAFMLSNCMVIVDLIEESKQSEESPTAQPASQNSEPAMVSENYRDFPITLLDGSTTTLNDHEGKTVMMVFFSVGCGFCQKEFTHLEAIYQEYKDQGFIIIASEVSGADMETIADFAEAYGVTFPIGNEINPQFASYVQVTGVPHNAVIDTQGNIVDTIRGFRDEQSLRTSIEKQLSQ